MEIDFNNIRKQLLSKTVQLIDFLNEQEAQTSWPSKDKFLKIDIDDLEPLIAEIRYFVIDIAAIRDENGVDVLKDRIIPSFPTIEK